MANGGSVNTLSLFPGLIADYHLRSFGGVAGLTQIALKSYLANTRGLEMRPEGDCMAGFVLLSTRSFLKRNNAYEGI